MGGNFRSSETRLTHCTVRDPVTNKSPMNNKIVPLVVCLAGSCLAQRVELRDAPELVMPGRVDSNSPAFWRDGRLHLLNSTGGEDPVLTSGRNQFRLSGAGSSRLARQQTWPAWIEAVWVDPTGVIFAWYHQEHEWVCGGDARPAQPHIGAAMSYDGGKTFFDAGVILSSPFPINCSSQNGYFSGGHGDFSVIPDRENGYFYFLFTNYAGPREEQGVAIARMAWGQRFHPAGAVWKYHRGGWSQPGVRGRVTPVFPATETWQAAGTDSFWGPSVHWNTHLQSYVMLMNRSCCAPGFPQEGIYIAFNPDLSRVHGWTKPEKILDDSGWYPQILGMGRGETDSVAGARARLYIYGVSTREIRFIKADREEGQTDQEQQPEPEPEREPEPPVPDEIPQDPPSLPLPAPDEMQDPLAPAFQRQRP